MMLDRTNQGNPQSDPIFALAQQPDDGVLAIIADIDGPSYRPLGAMMAFLDNGVRVGTLSSGCIEADLAHHAEGVRKNGCAKMIRYGKGSPYMDIQLPCGGGLEILLVPHPDPDILSGLLAAKEARQAVGLEIDCSDGTMRLNIACSPVTERKGARLLVYQRPELQFFIFGKGPEAATFANLAHSTLYPHVLLSPDQETLRLATLSGSPTRHIARPRLPEDVSPDRWTAIVLFFHDHGWEPDILAAALASPAFYIGAQGSRRAHETRIAEMAGLGFEDAALTRIRGPIGLIPSTRDAKTLAVSVLAEILALHNAR